MCWKRNKPRTVWVGRCWAYTVPCAPCSPASNNPAPAGPLGAWKSSRENIETPQSPNQLVFDSSPCTPLTSLSSGALFILITVQLAEEIVFYCFILPLQVRGLKYDEFIDFIIIKIHRQYCVAGFVISYNIKKYFILFYFILYYIMLHDYDICYF